MPAALLFAADAAGALHVVAGVGSWGGDETALDGLAEMLRGGAGDVLDVTGAIEGARFAAGARLGDGEGALLVLDPESRSPDPVWAEAFALSTALALGLVRAEADRHDPGRLLHEVAVHPGTFDERLDLALHRVTEALGLDAAALVTVGDGTWTPHTVYDPSGHLLPLRPVLLDQTYCAVTVQTDGPFVVEDGAQTGFGIEVPAAYLGAPVFVQGRCVGTFCAVGRLARSRPFSDDDRALVESLARWTGSALQGAEVGRQLAAREADLSAFFDGAPMGMGVVRLLDGDLEFVRVNATASAALGFSPDLLAGRAASEIGLGGTMGRTWLGACHRALDGGHPERFEMVAQSAGGARRLATTVSAIASAPHAADRLAFVVEDVTDVPSPPAPAPRAPVALFAADARGRLVLGRGLDHLGADAQAGGLLHEVFPEAADAVASALSGQSATWRVVGRGRTFEVHVPGRPPGAPAGLLGVVFDVTGVADAAGTTTAAHRALMTHLDHEIRSPLTSILGYADLLDAHATPEDLAEVRGVIERAGERLMATLDELALLGGDGIEVHPEPVDVCAVLVAATEAARPAADARRLSLNLLCLLPEVPLLLDAALFERLARTLVSGAVASSEGLRVDVDLRAADPALFELRVTGGSWVSTNALRESVIPRLAEALGGHAWFDDAGPGGWTLRLPRRPAPVVDFGEAADGSSGEAPEMVVAPAPA